MLRKINDPEWGKLTSMNLFSAQQFIVFVFFPSDDKLNEQNKTRN